MTRINLIAPAELCDQHLLAEHRELTRIPNAVAKRKFSLLGQPEDYKLGTGHVRFFLTSSSFSKNVMTYCIKNVELGGLMCNIFGPTSCQRTITSG